MELVEVCCPVESWPGYFISNFGRAYGPRSHGEPLRTEVTESGHLRVTFYRAGKKHHHAVHKLVARAFIGPRPPKMLILHGNGDHQDNVWTNLRYGSDSENNADTLAHGRHRTAGIVICLAGLHKLTEENTGHSHGRRYCRACRRLRAHAGTRGGAT